MRAQYKLWGLVLVCLVIVQAGGSLALARHTFALAAFSDVLQCLLLGCAALPYFVLATKLTGRIRAFWWLMGLGLAAWLSYGFLWMYFEVVLRRDVPGLFIGDAVLFLHFVPMMAALALQPNLNQDDRELRLGSLDFAFLLLWWVYLYIYTVIPWQYVFENSSAYDHNFNIAYLFEKAAYLGAVLLLWTRSSGPWKRMFAHWFGASVLYSSSSYVANWAISHHRYYSGSLYDLPLVASMAWMSVPALQALSMPSQQAQAGKSLSRGVWTARLGMLAVFSLPVFAWFSLFDHSIPPAVRTFRLAWTLAAMLLMGGLVFLKQHFLDIELMHLLRSSRKSFQDLQVLQAQLVQSEKLASMGQLVGGAAHELNNPLTAMLGYSELLATTELTPEQRALSEKISQQAKRIRSLVSSLLSFAKQAPTAKSALDVNVLVSTALRRCQSQLLSAKVQIATDLADSLPRVHGDSNQLLQVFAHIIGNAANAMADRNGGVLTLVTRADRAYVGIEFSDSGPGIKEPAKVFDPFYTTRPVGQGTGLGLSMCYGIVQEHAGKIYCRNRQEGGATFIVELPAMESARAEELQAQAFAAK
jgi:signal transduction histidine kinase